MVKIIKKLGAEDIHTKKLKALDSKCYTQSAQNLS